jgi:poly(beta-D-mannuronate) lyase
VEDIHKKKKKRVTTMFDLRPLRYYLYMLSSLLLILIFTSPARSAELNSPFNVTISQKHQSMGYSCPTPHKAPLALATGSVYKKGDPTHAVKDPKAERAYNYAIKYIRSFVQRTSRMANYAVRDTSKQRFYADCTLAWMHNWAEKGALSELATHNAKIGIGNYMSGIALSYLQVQAVLPNDPRHATIQQWLKNVAANYVPYFNANPDNKSSRNNLRYWAGLSAAAIGVAANDKPLFDWGIASARLGIGQINNSGVLALELARGQRARDYHLHATAPLIMIAELAKANNIDLYRERGSKLHRLVLRTASAVIDDSYFRKATSKRQISMKSGGKMRTHLIAWMAPYGERFDNNKYVNQLTNKYKKLASSNLGGDLTMLF